MKVMMSVLGNMTAAAVFDNREAAETAWSALADADIPASVVTDPGIMGAYEVRVMVERDDLNRAMVVLAPLING